MYRTNSQLTQHSQQRRSLVYFCSTWKCLVAVLWRFLTSYYNSRREIQENWRIWCGLIFIWACVSALTVLLLLHTAYYRIPGLKEPSGFWTVLDVATSGVRPMLCHLLSFTHSENFGLLNQFFGKQFYHGDLIGRSNWKNGLFIIEFRNNVDKENSLFWEDKCNWWVFRLSNRTPLLTNWFIFQVNNNFVLFIQRKKTLILFLLLFCISACRYLGSWAVKSQVCFILKLMIWMSLYPGCLPNPELEIIHFYKILFSTVFCCQLTGKLVENGYWLPRPMY